MKYRLLTTCAILNLGVSINYGSGFEPNLSSVLNAIPSHQTAVNMSSFEQSIELLARNAGLITTYMNENNRNAIPPHQTAVNMSSIDQNKDIETLATNAGLIEKDMSGNDRATVIGSLVLVPSEQCKDVVGHALRLIKADMNGYGRAEVIQWVAKVPAEQRENVVSHALRLITKDMRGYYRARVIQSVASIPADEREDFVKHALRLITADMDGDDRAAVIESVAKVPDDQRADFVKHASDLITDNMKGHERAWVIPSVAKVPADQRENVVKHALALITADMDGYNRTEVIESLSKVPSDQRADVVTHASDLITADMDGYHRATVIGSVANVPAEQREDFVTHALRLITPDMNANNRIQIIINVTNLPSDQRENVINHALVLITDNMNGYHRGAVIAFVARIRDVNRPAFVQFCLNNRVSRHEMEGLSSVPNPNDWPETLGGMRNCQADQIVGLNKQTVHDYTYETSIKKAIEKLQERYGKKKLLSFKALAENYKTKWEALSNLQHGLSNGEIKVLEKFFDRGTDVPKALEDYLNLAWYALTDTDNLISQDTNEGFLGWFRAGPIDAQLAYVLDNLGGKYKNKEALLTAIEEGNESVLTQGRSCMGGQLNRLIDGLNLIHPDVTLQAGEGQIKNAQVMKLRQCLQKASIAWLADKYTVNPKLFEENSSKRLFKEGKKELDKTYTENKEDFDKLNPKDIQAYMDAVLNELNLDEDLDAILTENDVSVILEKI